MKITFGIVLVLLLSGIVSCGSTGGNVHTSYGIHYSHGYGYGYPRYYPHGGYGPPIYRPRPPVYRPGGPSIQPLPATRPMPRARPMPR